MNTNTIDSIELAKDYIAKGKNTWNAVCSCKEHKGKFVKVDIMQYATLIHKKNEKQIKVINHAIVRQFGN